MLGRKLRGRDLKGAESPEKTSLYVVIQSDPKAPVDFDNGLMIDSYA